MRECCTRTYMPAATGGMGAVKKPDDGGAMLGDRSSCAGRRAEIEIRRVTRV